MAFQGSAIYFDFAYNPAQDNLVGKDESGNTVNLKQQIYFVVIEFKIWNLRSLNNGGFLFLNADDMAVTIYILNSTFTNI